MARTDFTRKARRTTSSSAAVTSWMAAATPGLPATSGSGMDVSRLWGGSRTPRPRASSTQPSTSVAPRDGLKDEAANDGGVTGPGAVKQDWTTFSGYFQRAERQGISINLM